MTLSHLARVVSLFALTVAVALLAFPAGACPVLGETQRLRQPDGERVSVRVWGDERYQRVESLDGYPLFRDPKSGVICYARLKGGIFESTGIRVDETAPKAVRAEKGSRESSEHIRAVSETHEAVLWGKTHGLSRPADWVCPSQGDIVGITLVVNFPEELDGTEPGIVRLFCNLPGFDLDDNTGSVYDYFLDASNGLFRYTNWVPDAYYTAQNAKSYYDDPDTPAGDGARALVLEALNYYEANGFDFSAYDANGDGYIDAVNCLFVGNSESGWAMGLTPHAGHLDFEADGVKAISYQITPMAGALDMAKFVHENGHMLFGWADLYDKQFDSKGLGEYCLMSYGTYPGDPIHPCAYLKDDVGWDVTTRVTGSMGPVTLEHPAFHALKVVHPYNPREYFLIENRQRSGRDTRLFDSGLMVLHVDRDGWNSYQQMTPEYHYEAALEQADGRFDLEMNFNKGDTMDLYGAPSDTHWGTGTTPNSKWWDGSESDLRLYNISYPSSLMTFSVEYEPKVTPVDPVQLSGDPHYDGVAIEAAFQFSNPESSTASWQVGTDAAWLGITPDAGVVDAGSAAAITASVIAENTPELPGAYDATLTFSLPDQGTFWKRRVVFTYIDAGPATADRDGDWSVSLSELLLGVQLFQSEAYHCAPDSPDGYAVGAGDLSSCRPYSADYAPQDGRVDLSELLRLIQLFNSGGYHRDPGTEDHFAPGAAA